MPEDKIVVMRQLTAAVAAIICEYLPLGLPQSNSRQISLCQICGVALGRNQTQTLIAVPNPEKHRKGSNNHDRLADHLPGKEIERSEG